MTEDQLNENENDLADALDDEADAADYTTNDDGSITIADSDTNKSSKHRFATPVQVLSQTVVMVAYCLVSSLTVSC